MKLRTVRANLTLRTRGTGHHSPVPIPPILFVLSPYTLYPNPFSPHPEGAAVVELRLRHHRRAYAAHPPRIGHSGASSNIYNNVAIINTTFGTAFFQRTKEKTNINRQDAPRVRARARW